MKALVAVRMSRETELLERRRRKCLEYLLSTLTVDGCEG